MQTIAHPKPTDSNEQTKTQAIDKVLEAVPGLTLEKLDNFKVRRLIGYRGKNYLFEYKEVNATFAPEQIDFFRTWNGQVNIISDPRDALFVLNLIK